MKTSSSDRVAFLEDQIRVLEDAFRKERREKLFLRHQLEILKKRLFGPRSEQIAADQLQLAFDERDELFAPPPEPVSPPEPEAPPRKSRRNGRAPLPKDLPREREEIHPPAEERICRCCAKEMVPIGEEVTEELEYEPAVLFVREIVRVKYGCRRCEEGVVIADLPLRPVEKGRPGPGLLAWVATAKYSDHLPLNRLEGILARSGVEISRKTMCDWIRDVADLLSPIVKRMKSTILSSGYVQTDDTSVRLRDEGGRRSYLWVYLSPEQRAAVYDFTISRARDGPARYLRSFRGFLQSDAYSVYDGIVSREGITGVACWAHCRRKWLEALDTSPEHASTVLAGIRRLYALEAAARAEGLSSEDRLGRRREQAVRILDAIKEYVDAIREEALPRSPLGTAVGYTLSQWDGLNAYARDGRLEIDNNAAERALRRVAVGRKNYMFFGSPDGGRRAAILYSLVETCRLVGIDPHAYLKDVLLRVKTHPSSRIEELMPAGWKAAHKAAVAAD